MRVAICISGLMRTYSKTYGTFVDNIIKPNSHHDIDVFISTWCTEHSNVSMERTRHVWWYGDKSKPFPEVLIDYADIHSKYAPVAFCVERQHTFDISWYTDPPCGPINAQAFMSMVYKIYSCDLLRRRHEELVGPYDVVVRLRTDNKFERPITIDSLDLSCLTVPHMRDHIVAGENWLSDQFAVGNGSDMSKYSDWYLNVANLVGRGVLIQPETLLYYHLLEHAVRFVELSYELPIVRLEGH